MRKPEAIDKILQGSLKREEADNGDLCNFLQLLQLKEKQTRRTLEFNEITIDDQRAVVEKYKGKSVPSIFSKQTHVVHKIIAKNE